MNDIIGKETIPEPSTSSATLIPEMICLCQKAQAQGSNRGRYIKEDPEY